MKGIIRSRLQPRISLPSRLKHFITFVDPAPIVLVTFGALLLFQGISSRGLWASHEARAAQNAQRMLDDGEWLLPRLYDGQVETQKPPLFYWLVAAIGWARGGADAWTVRLPAIVAGVLTMLMVWWHLRQRGRPIAGFVAAAMLVGALHFTGTARIGRIDAPLACLVTAIMLVAKKGDAALFLGKSCVPFLLGLALVLKGPIGVVLPIASLLVYWIIERVPLRITLLLTWAIGSLAVALPWYLYADAATNGRFLREFILYHHFHRAFGGAEALAGHPFWYYLPRFAADFLPWTPLLIVALIARRWRGDADARFGLIWLGVMVVVLSLSRFKRADYLLPAYAGAAIFLACAIEQWYLARSAKSRRRLAVSFMLFLGLLPLAWYAFDRLVTDKQQAARDQEPLAQRIRDIAPIPQPIVLFRVESHQLAFHLGRPVHTLVEWADLNAIIAQTGPHYVVTRAEFVDEVRRHARLPFTVVAGSEPIDNVRPHRPLIVLRFDGVPCPTPPRD